MRTPTAIARALGLCLAASAVLTAQGDKLPQVSFEGFGNSEAKSLDDFDGRLILVEAFAFW